MVRSAIAAQRAGSPATGAVNGVAKKPGAMALVFTPWRDQASACARVSCITPPFDAPYGPLLPNARTDCSEAMLMIRPQPLAIIAGASFCARKNGASRLSLSVASQSPSLISVIGRRTFTPAAETRMSGAPKNAGALPAHSAIAPRSVRSQAIDAALLPLAEIRLQATSSSAARRATSTTAAPASARASAIAPPMPELAPVTRATLPVRSKSCGMRIRARPASRARTSRPGSTCPCGHPPFARALPCLPCARCAP